MPWSRKNASARVRNAAQRFHRTLLVEWAYWRAYRSNTARLAALDAYLHRYNTQRGHAAHRGRAPPDQRPRRMTVNNVPVRDS